MKHSSRCGRRKAESPLLITSSTKTPTMAALDCVNRTLLAMKFVLPRILSMPLFEPSNKTHRRGYPSARPGHCQKLESVTLKPQLVGGEDCGSPRG